MWFTEYSIFLSAPITWGSILSAIFIISIMLLENRSPIKTISWILVLLLMPIIGIILYLFFGQNLRKRKIIRRKGLKNHSIIQEIAQSQIKTLPQSDLFYISKLNNMHNLMQLQLNNSNSIIRSGNRVTLLENGEVKFKALKADLLKATSFIHMQYYILVDDNIGREIINILKKKAQEGVEVRIIVDDVGSWSLNKHFFKELRAAGIEIHSFLTVHFPLFTNKVNYRNHRKIIIIDGQIAYMGGINIADKYIKGVEELGVWRDTHIKIEGESVSSLQTIFSIDWYFVSQIELNESKYYPPCDSLGDKIVQISSSAPDSDWPGIMMGFVKLISNARDYVYITSPYFMPTESILMALKSAAMSGVDVRIIIPDKSDVTIPRYSSFSYIREIMTAGVKVYLYKKGFIHSKVIVSDNIITSIGSCNMDFRSFEQNFEVTAFIYDQDFACTVKESLNQDFADSERLDLLTWKKRPLTQKIKESLARLFSPLL